MLRYLKLVFLLLILAFVYVVVPQLESDADVKYEFNCTEPDRCVEAQHCYMTTYLLKGTEDDVRRAQMMYCGEVTSKTVNDTARYGFGPAKGATGPPLACCNPNDYIRPTRFLDHCSKYNPYLRLRTCGRTPVFFLNFAAKAYLQARDVQYNRLNRERCATTPPTTVTQPSSTSEASTSTTPEITGGKKKRRSLKEEIRNKRAAGKRDKRLAGGYPARIGQFPFMAQIYYSDYTKYSAPFFGCQSTIIHHQIVMTTRHCTKKGFMAEIWVGMYDLNNITRRIHRYQMINDLKYYVDPAPQLFHVNTIVYHEKHAERINRTLINPYDIAIIKVGGSMKFNDFVEPVCIPVRDAKQGTLPPYSGTATAIGYGYRSQFRGKTLPRFRKLQILDIEKCVDAYTYYYSQFLTFPMIGNHSAFICAGSDEEAEGTCTNDEGSPLLLESFDGRYYQIGMMISQLPEVCGFKDRPILYLQISQFQRYIRAAIWTTFHITSDKEEREKIPDEFKCLTYEEGGYGKGLK